MNLDQPTQILIDQALRKRVLECEIQGLSTRFWDEALRKFRLAIAQETAKQLRVECDEPPAFLRLQCGPTR